MIGRYFFILLLPACFVLLAIVGTARSFSATPYWDMWDGQIGFFLKSAAGAGAAWWEFHNEHRLVLSRTLFWADLAVFDQGRTPFLVVMNLVLAAALAVVLIGYLRALALTSIQGTARWALAALLVVLCFSWAQQENFPWGFQSQFFLVQILPLLTFLAMATCMGAEGPRRWRFLALTIGLGVASTATMANGLLAMPLAFGLALVSRRARPLELVLALIAALLVVVFARTGYVAPAGQVSALSMLIDRPADAAEFVLRYLGSPAHFAWGGARRAFIAGLIVVAITVALAWRILGARRPEPVELALLAHVGFVTASAVATAGGRLIFGPDSALASRYTTSVLGLWAVLVLLLVSRHRSWFARRPGALTVLCLVFALALLPLQIKATRVDRGTAYNRDLAAQAIALQVRDPDLVRLVYPDVETVLGIGRQAAAADLSVFGAPALTGAMTTSWTQGRSEPVVGCSGFVDRVSPVKGDPDFVRIDGWIFAPDSRRVPVAAQVQAADGTPIGHVRTGGQRRDVAVAVDAAAARSGFSGYVRADRLADVAGLLGRDPLCRMPASPPAGSGAGPRQ